MKTVPRGTRVPGLVEQGWKAPEEGRVTHKGIEVGSIPGSEDCGL